jgi:hypothetical protein
MAATALVGLGWIADNMSSYRAPSFTPRGALLGWLVITAFITYVLATG